MNLKHQEHKTNSEIQVGKTAKITYYITTGIISATMILIGFKTLVDPEVKTGMAQLGFSADFFRMELGITKIIGAVLLWLPIRLLKEFTYFGFAITFVSAALAHFSAGDPTSRVLIAIVFFIILLVSYLCHYNLQAKKTK